MVDLCAAADAGADTMAPLSLSRMAPDPSRHARAVLVLAFHAVALAPAGYWTGITGLLLVPLLAAGAWSAGVALAGRIGHGRRSHGRITALEHKRDGVLEVECRLDAGWRGHQAGQFAFVRFDRREGARIRTPSPARPGRMAPSASKSRRWATTPRGFRRAARGPAGGGSKAPTAASSLDADAGAPQVWVGRHRRHALPGLAGHPWPPTRAVRPARNCTTARDAAADPFAATLRERCAALPLDPAEHP